MDSSKENVKNFSPIDYIDSQQMLYKPNTEGILYGLKWILLFTIIAILLILVSDIRFAIGTIVIYLALVILQLYLIIQYENATKYKNFQIDYTNNIFIITLKDRVVEKSFTDLKTLHYHKAVPPPFYSSLAVNLCGHLYYYKFEFKDGDNYYLTSLLDPELKFEAKGVFYDYYLELERKYATIK